MKESEPQKSGAPSKKPLPRWKKVLVACSIVAVVLGGGLKAYSHFASPDDAGKQRSSDPSRAGAPNSLVGESNYLEGPPRTGTQHVEGTDTDAAPAGAADSLSPLFLKGGLSFFVGFCIGLAARTFFRMTALFLGIGLVAVFALQYFKILPPIDWAAIDAHFQSLMASLSRQASGFKAFVEGNLPSSAAAAGGLFTGFKKS